MPVVLVGIMSNVANAQLVWLILFPPLFHNVMIPKIEKRATPLHRMGWGLVVAALGMGMVGTLTDAKALWWQRRCPPDDEQQQLSILWLMPQFVTLGVSNTLFIVAQMDFFYTEILDSKPTLGSSLFLMCMCMGLGSYMSTLIMSIVTSLTTIAPQPIDLFIVFTEVTMLVVIMLHRYKLTRRLLCAPLISRDKRLVTTT